jgi:cytochrome oxidase Cu insertion factor (SCO1/SenC/PrrC family)
MTASSIGRAPAVHRYGHGVKALVALAAGAVLLGVTAVLAVALTGDSGAAQQAERAPYVGSRPPEGTELPRFTLRDDRGGTIRAEDLRGQVVVVTFLDAQCTDACPIAGGELARAVDAMTPAERARVEVLGLSTDPTEDTPRAVAAYLARHRATGRIRYLTAPQSEMEPVWDAFHILPTAETGDDSLHSIPIQIYDGDGIWRSTLNVGADLSRRNLLHDVRLALGETG